MDRENTSLAKDIEELINKSIEANKVFLSESSKLVRGFTTPGEKKTSTIFQPNFFAEAFNAYAKMNIQHIKNMLDLGVSLVKKAGTQSSTDAAEDPTPEQTPEPAFILKGAVEQGGKLALSFLLDNIKQAAVLCKLVNTSYSLQSDPLIEENFITNFSPQSFMLKTGEQQRINIDISVPVSAKPGVYISNAQVQGFEPAYFSILLTVNEIPTKTATDGRNTKKRTK